MASTTQEVLRRVQMGKNRESGPSATWPYDIVMMFCDLCLREIALGNRPGTHFTKVGWTNLAYNFKEYTGNDYDRFQLKNKWNQLKKEWKLWKDLKMGATDCGWNPKKRTLDAPDEWWKEKIQEFPAVKRLRYNGIDPAMEEKLDKMFMNMIPPGVTEEGHEYLKYFESSKSLPGDVKTLDGLLQPSGDSKISPQLSSHVSSPQLSSHAQENKNKNGCPKSGVSGAALGVWQMLQEHIHQSQMLRTQIQELVDAATNINKTPVASNKSLSSITEAVVELDSIEELEDNTELYGFAIDLLMQKDSREMFMALKPHKKVWYLKIEYEKSKRNTS